MYNALMGRVASVFCFRECGPMAESPYNKSLCEDHPGASAEIR